jgi:hypothetical protein
MFHSNDSVKIAKKSLFVGIEATARCLKTGKMDNSRRNIKN